MSVLKVNDYVRYGSNGICKVEEIKLMSFSYDTTKKEYYLLKPVNDAKSTLYVPKDNNALMAKICPVLSKEQIDALIVSARDCKLDWIDDRNARNTAFQSILKKSDQRELMLLINCIYLKKLELEKAGKKLCATDKSVLERAEKSLQNDFSFILGIDKDKIGEYISEKMGISRED